MKTYRRKNGLFLAVRYPLAVDEETVAAWCRENDVDMRSYDRMFGSVRVESAFGGSQRIGPGDWLVDNQLGKRDCYSDGEFRARFEECEDLRPVRERLYIALKLIARVSADARDEEVLDMGMLEQAKDLIRKVLEETFPGG